jgi:hypothetical protein
MATGVRWRPLDIKKRDSRERCLTWRQTWMAFHLVACLNQHRPVRVDATELDGGSPQEVASPRGLTTFPAK